MLFNPFDLAIELDTTDINMDEFYSRVQDETSFLLSTYLVQFDEKHTLFKITRAVFTAPIMTLMEYISVDVDDRNFLMLLIDSERNETYKYGKLKSRFGLELAVEWRSVIRYKNLQDLTNES